MYATTDGIATHATVALPPNIGLPQIVQGRNGTYFSKYGIGQPLAAAPLYALGHFLAPILGRPADGGARIPFFFVRFLPIGATVLSVWLVYLFGSWLYRSPRTGIGLALLYGLGTLSWPYARFFFSEPLYGLCIIASAFCMYRAAQTMHRGRCRIWLAAAGFLVSYALLVKVAGATLLPAYALYLWLSPFACETNINKSLHGSSHPARRNRLQKRMLDTTVVTAAALPGILLLLAHNYVRFGNPFDNGYEGEGFITPLWQGISGLLFSSGKSIFLYAPVLCAFPFAVWQFARRFPREALFFGLLSGITLIYSSLWWQWWGGWSWGPRFLVPILPLAVLPLGTLLQRSRIAAGIIWVVLFPLGVFVQVLGVIPDFNVYLSAVTHNGTVPEYRYLLEGEYSPLVSHWRMLWLPGVNTARGLALEQVGLNSVAALIISAGLCLLFLLSLIMLCGIFLQIPTLQPDTHPDGGLPRADRLFRPNSAEATAEESLSQATPHVARVTGGSRDHE